MPGTAEPRQSILEGSLSDSANADCFVFRHLQVPGTAAPRRSFLDDQLDGDTALRSLLDASLESFNTRTRCDSPR